MTKKVFKILSHYFLSLTNALPVVLAMLRSDDQRKHVFRWLKSQKRGYLLDEPSPWLTFDAIEFIKPRMFSGMRVFEYGSGGSTLLRLSNGANVVAIEHNKDWYELVSQRLGSNHSVDYRLVLPEPAVRDYARLIPSPSDPENYLAKDIPQIFQNYVTQIDDYPDEHFDVILIDGRARPSCVKHSVHKVKKGGVLILDNADREYYLRDTGGLLESFDSHQFVGYGPKNGHKWMTTVFVKIYDFLNKSSAKDVTPYEMSS